MLKKPAQNVFSTNTTAQPWMESISPVHGESCYFKSCVEADMAGIMVREYYCPAGYNTPWHTHSCGHGIYVIEGIMKTHEGHYGPGSFIWFNEGDIMEHGATDNTGVRFLLISNKPFDHIYLDQKEQ